MLVLKNLLSYSLIFISLSLSAQKNIELSGGMLQNNFRDPFGEDALRKETSYTSEWGYSIRFSIDEVQVDWLKMRFTLGYNYLGGSFKSSDGSQGGSFSIDANFNKSLLTLAVYPAHLEIGRLLWEDFRGITIASSRGQAIITENVEELYDEFNSKAYFGLNLRFAYDIKITENWALSPQYNLYYGLSQEFYVPPETSRSYQHFFAIGLQRALK